MKKNFLKIAINLITKQQPNLDQIKIQEIKYGLEGIYLTITKFLIIFILCWILNIVIEFFIFLILYNLIRIFAFGLHAKKSSYCLISSICFFVIFPFLATFINIPILLKIIISSFCILMIILYAPADTHKRPLINKFKRLKFKIFSTIVAIVFVILSFVINNNFLANSLILALLLEVILILPITYKIFNLPYNNYKNYYSS